MFLEIQSSGSLKNFSADCCLRRLSTRDLLLAYTNRSASYGRAWGAQTRTEQLRHEYWEDSRKPKVLLDCAVEASHRGPTT